jgi:FHA domain-containing protein
VSGTCPAGHPSDTDDYCDVCGTPMGTTPPSSDPAPTPEPKPEPEPAKQAASAEEPAEPCAECGAPRTGRFCEECGHDSASAARPGSGVPGPPRGAAVTWSAVVTADRDWFEQVRRRDGPDAGSVEFPPYCPPRRFPLDGERLTIGRRSRSRGIEPDIDLTGPPLDPGVSALHAMLLATPDGWSVVDLDSTNGTTLRAADGERTVPPNTPTAVAEHDVLCLGAWTTLRLSRH